jgi:hypothetical protein
MVLLWSSFSGDLKKKFISFLNVYHGGPQNARGHFKKKTQV